MNLDEKVARKYIALSESAKVRGIEFDLPLTSLINLYRAKKCYYTGKPFKGSGNTPYSLTLDRVDNRKGYVKGNVVACCAYINHAKGSLSPDEIELLHKKVKGHLK